MIYEGTIRGTYARRAWVQGAGPSGSGFGVVGDLSLSVRLQQQLRNQGRYHELG